MKFGICVPIQDAPHVPLGCDFVELPLNAIAQLTSAEWKEACRMLNDAPPCEAVNLFFPGDIRLIGDNAETERALIYANHALARAAQLGVSVAILGSGGPRTAPLRYPIDGAEAQFIELLHKIGEIGVQLGTKIAVEPLNRRETNLAFTLNDASRIAESAHSPAIGTMVDAFHFRLGNEPMISIVEAQNLLHVHYACVLNRALPQDVAEEADAPAFFAALKARSYDARLSLEAADGNARHGIHVLREMAKLYMA